MAKAAAKRTKKHKKTKKKRIDAQDLPVDEVDEEEDEQGQEEDSPSTAVATIEEPPVEEISPDETAPDEAGEDVAVKDSAKKKGKEEEESTHAKYERVKKGNLYLTDLQKLTVAELHDLAKKEGITEYTALKKTDLIFRILKERIRQNGLMYGEGVLEVLPDGYGFLRNPSYNYLSSSDDIYVSPSQIRRFGLRTGNTVSGQIRPPKDSEK